MGEMVIWISFVSVIVGAFVGAGLGAHIAKRTVFSLTDLVQPDRDRIARGAAIGVLFGMIVTPKMAVISYVLMTVMMKL